MGASSQKDDASSQKEDSGGSSPRSEGVFLISETVMVAQDHYQTPHFRLMHGRRLVLYLMVSLLAELKHGLAVRHGQRPTAPMPVQLVRSEDRLQVAIQKVEHEVETISSSTHGFLGMF